MKTRMNRRQFIKSSAQAGILLGLSGESYWGASKIFGQGFDLIIKNGTVIDGIKDESYKADLGIIGEHISVVGNLQAEKGRTIIDATARTVCPGFIDIHSHTDFELLINPKAESKIRQGVTTELSGNCGDSVFPRKKVPPEEEKRTHERIEFKADWVDLDGYRAELAKKGIAVNHGTLLGNGTLRDYAMGEERREPSLKEMEFMKTPVYFFEGTRELDVFKAVPEVIRLSNRPGAFNQLKTILIEEVLVDAGQDVSGGLEPEFLH